MRKVVLTIMLMIFVCLSLTGCVRWKTSESYELMQKSSNIKSICVYSENLDSEMLYDYSDPDDPCGKLLGEIQKEQFPAFTEELTKLSFSESHIIFLFPVAYDPNFYYGDYIVKIEYTDGGCELISDIIQRQFRVNEKYPDTTRYDTDQESWLAFLQRWVNLPD